MIKEPKIQNRLFPSVGKSKILVLGAVLLALVLSACGELTPNNETTQLLINEVYTGPTAGGSQWLELVNNTNDPLNLNGYTLITTRGTIDLGAITSAAGSGKNIMSKGATIVFANSPQSTNDQLFAYLQNSAVDDTAKAAIKRPPLPYREDKVLGKLDPSKDVIALKGPDGKIIDQLGWGNPDLNGLGLANDTNTKLAAPASENKSLGRTPPIGQRAVGDPGELNNPGLFSIHNTPTPGPGGIARAPASFNFLFTTFTDAIATVGAAVLWVAFIIIALVAQRFETLSEQKTYWRWLMAAPAGILIYAILQVQDFIRTGRLTDFWSWPAFLALFISGIACVYVINIFRLIAKNILEAE